MSFTDFSKIQYVKTFDTGEEVRLGSFSPGRLGQLQHIRVTMYNEGKTPTTEQLRLNIYSDSNYSSILYQSSYAELGNISNKSDNWIGWVRVDFNRVNMNPNLTYYVAAELNNYTRVSGTSFISLAYDFPFPIYGDEDIWLENAIQMQVFSYGERSS